MEKGHAFLDYFFWKKCIYEYVMVATTFKSIRALTGLSWKSLGFFFIIFTNFPGPWEPCFL